MDIPHPLPTAADELLYLPTYDRYLFFIFYFLFFIGIMWWCVTQGLNHPAPV